MSQHVFCAGAGAIAGFATLCGMHRVIDALSGKYDNIEPYNVYKFRRAIMFPKSAEGNFAAMMIMAGSGIFLGNLAYKENVQIMNSNAHPCLKRAGIFMLGTGVLFISIVNLSTVLRYYDRGVKALIGEKMNS